MDEEEIIDLPLFVTAPVTGVPHPHLDEPQMVVLARDMAWNIRDPDIILGALGVTQEQFDTHVKRNAFYKRAYETFLVEWESANSTNKRIAVKSAAALEDLLPSIGARMANAKEGLPAVVETAKLFAKLAGAGEEKRDSSPGEKFTITINLGADKLRFEETVGKGIEILEVQQLSEGTNAEAEIRPIREGDTLQPHGEKT